MKKLLALACASSVLALATGANAQTTPNTSYALTVNGTIAAFCNIKDAAGNYAQTKSWTVFDNGVGGVVGSQNIDVPLTVSGNSKCDYLLASTNANLVGPGGATLTYSAGMNIGGTPAVAPVTATAQTISASSISGDVTLNVRAQTIANTTGTVAPGTYADLLTITVHAS